MSLSNDHFGKRLADLHEFIPWGNRAGQSKWVVWDMDWLFDRQSISVRLLISVRLVA